MDFLKKREHVDSKMAKSGEKKSTKRDNFFVIYYDRNQKLHTPVGNGTRLEEKIRSYNSDTKPTKYPVRRWRFEKSER